MNRDIYYDMLSFVREDLAAIVEMRTGNSVTLNREIAQLRDRLTKMLESKNGKPKDN